ncbi:DUF6415 family natural product biosynthesis protein [Streptomyces sp. NPDC002920]
MTSSTTRQSGTGEAPAPPLDIETMRASTRRFLAANAEPPSLEELTTLTLQLRSHIMAAIPEVEAAAKKLPLDDWPRHCAFACLGAVRQRLSAEPGRTLSVGIEHAQGLARSLNALCDHYENLGCEHS